VLLVLPGSRPSELRRTAPHLFAAAGLALREAPDARVVVVAAQAIAAAAAAMAKAQDYPVLVVAEADGKADAFAAATAALAVSGTVTTEVALQETPVVVGYRLGWTTWALARAFLYKSPFATLMNVAAGREIAPEFIQTQCTGANLARAVVPLLCDPQARARQVEAQDAALASMGRSGRPAADIAAETVLKVLNPRF
jgi:lipid-A-disaccharide synthase